MAAITSAANTGVTEMDLIASIVEENRLVNTILLNTTEDRSNLLTPGVKILELPRFHNTDTAGFRRFGDPATQNVDGETPVTKQTVTLQNDVINLDQWKNLSYSLADRLIVQSRVPLISEFAKQAGKDMARYQDDSVRTLYATLSQTVDYDGPADADIPALTETISLSNISQSRMILDKQFVDRSDRFLIVSPAMEKAIINLDNFKNADQYGAREGILNGEVGRIYGYTVMMSNLLDDDECYAVQKHCVNSATQKGVDFETQREDVTLRSTAYSFAIGWGLTLMDGGAYGVKFQIAP